LKRQAVRHYEGGKSAKGRRFGIVVSRFNEYLTGKLLDSALDTLARHGADPKKVHVAHVPGAFEVPLAAKKLIRRVKPDSVLTLSVVIRGKTKHFDQVVTQCAKGVREVSLKADVPVILGMISADDPRDALERVEKDRMDKGREWALSAIEMANLSIKLGKKRA
jgi:6,7-dimethyl-8-ribityllumazine synthase